jgi:hypothetical protein
MKRLTAVSLIVLGTALVGFSAPLPAVAGPIGDRSAGVTVTATVTVPNVMFYPTQTAIDRVVRAGLVPVTNPASPPPNSYVYNQSPVGGTLVQAGSTVTLLVRQGPTP